MLVLAALRPDAGPALEIQASHIVRARVLDVSAPDTPPPLTEVPRAPSLPADHLVVAVLDRGVARAYPLSLLAWFPVVNDTIAGRPVLVVFSGLTGRAAVFERRINGGSATFGPAGKLLGGELVLYDRPSISLWVDGTAVDGAFVSVSLPRIPSLVTTFARFREAYPNGESIAGPAGARARLTPYGGYERRSTPPREVLVTLDRRLRLFARVLGVRGGSEARAYPFDRLRARGSIAVVHDRIADEEIVVLWEDAGRSVHDTTDLDQARTAGTAAAFVPRARGRRLTFEVRAGAIADRETGTVWSPLGVGLRGPLRGVALERRDDGAAFWFAWAEVNPRGTVWNG